MPKDFMCDRISENSPLRFLDFDASNMINLYRPSIPYVLQTIFNEGRWRSKRDRRIIGVSGDIHNQGVVKYRVRNPYNHGAGEDFHKSSWKSFCANMRLLEKLMLMWKYKVCYVNQSAEKIGELISAPKPQLKMKVGNQTIMVDCDTPITFGSNPDNHTRHLFSKEVSEIERRLRRHHHLLFCSGEGEGGCNSRRDYIHQLLIGGTQRHIGRPERKCSYRYDDNTINRWRKAVMKRQDVSLPYQIQGVDFYIPPLVPNIYMPKCEIMAIIKREYNMDDDLIKKLNKKYNTKQVVKMYWKEIIDCV